MQALAARRRSRSTARGRPRARAGARRASGSSRAISAQVRSELDIDRLLARRRRGDRPGAARRPLLHPPRPTDGGSADRASGTAPGLEPIGDGAARSRSRTSPRASARTVAIADSRHGAASSTTTSARRARGAARARLAGRARHADRRLRQLIGVLALHRDDARGRGRGTRSRSRRRSRARSASRSTSPGSCARTAAASRSRARCCSAAQVLTSDLRAADRARSGWSSEVAALLDADAADCYLFDPERGGAPVRGRPRPAQVADRLRVPGLRGLAGRGAARGRP